MKPGRIKHDSVCLNRIKVFDFPVDILVNVSHLIKKDVTKEHASHIALSSSSHILNTCKGWWSGMQINSSNPLKEYPLIEK